MTERYIDPNSGAAPQPGGFVAFGESNVQPEAIEETEETTEETPETPEEPETPETPETPEEPTGEDETEESEEEETPAEETPEEPAEGKDYSDLLSKSVDEVTAYIDEHPEEKDAIIAAESQREKPRKGITQL